MLLQSGDLGQRSTYRELIWSFLRWKPGSDGMTATQLCHYMQHHGWPIKLNSLSSQLTKMVKSKELAIHAAKKGPRGGKVYVLGEEG